MQSFVFAECCNSDCYADCRYALMKIRKIKLSIMPLDAVAECYAEFNDTECRYADYKEHWQRGKAYYR